MKINVENLIPKGKSDIETAEKLKNYSYEEVKEIIPNLLEWLQDLNWPVAKPVVEYLESINENITEELLPILKSENIDEEWKYWIVTIFGPITESYEIQKAILRIANSPTENEINHEVNEIAKEILTKRDWK